MSYGAKYHIIQKVTLGDNTLTYRAELLKSGYVGGSTKLEGHKDSGSFVLEYDKPGAEGVRKTPVLRSRLEVYILIRGASDRSILNTIFQADDDQYRLRLKLNSNVIWEGEVLTDMVELPEDNYKRGLIAAKDIQGLEAQDYTLATGRQKVIKAFADVLGDVGLGLDIKTIPSFSNKNTSDSDDWMNQIHLDKERFRTFSESEGEQAQSLNKKLILETLAKNTQCLILQSAGSWYLVQFTGQANDPATVYEYDAAGSQTGSSSVDFDAAVDRTNRWLLPSTRTIGTPGVKRVLARYEHKGSRKTILLPRRIEVAAGDLQKDFTLSPFNSSGTQHIELGFGVSAEGAGSETEVTAEIEFRAGPEGNYYWLIQENGSLKWSQSEGAYQVKLTSFDGDVDGGGINDPDNLTSNSGGRFFRANNRIVTPDMPADADGSVRIRFNAAEDQVPNVLDTTFYEVAFKLSESDEEADSKALSFDVSQDAGQVVYDLGETWFGDGPSRNAPGALWYDSGGGSFQPTNNDWRRVGGSSELPFHEVVGREIIDTQRSATQIIRARLMGLYQPHQIVTKNSGADRYVFIGGRLTGADAIWDADFLKINVDTDGDRSIGTIIDEGDNDVGGGGGTDPLPENEDGIGELTSDVSGTDVTSLPVEIYTGKAIESGKDYYVRFAVKGINNYFTAGETKDAGTFNLTIDSEPVITAPEGSKIYKDEGQVETERIIEAEAQTATETARAALSASVKNEREATSIGTTTAEVSGAGVTSISVEGIPFEVKLDDGDVLTLLDVVDSADGANAEVTVDGDQTLSAGTGTVNITSKTFSHTFPTGSAFFEPAVGLTARVTATARVTSQNSTNISSVTATANSNSSQVVLKAESTSGEITKMALVQLDSSVAGGSAITLAADQIKISGDTTFVNGYNPSDGRTTIRQNTAPTTRPSGDPLVDGDIWLDTDDGNKPYSWNGSSWIPDYTNIDGGNITTGTIAAARVTVGAGSTFTQGYDPSDGRVVIRQNATPTSRPSGDSLKEGDIWIDTDDGDKPYTYTGSAFQASYTIIDGGNITTGAIESGNFVAGSAGWQIDTNGDAEFNSVTIRDGDFVNPNFTGGEVSGIEIVNGLPASGDFEGQVFYDVSETPEPRGLYRWDGDSFERTIDGGDIVANSITAGKIAGVKLSVIQANAGTMTISSTGKITNSTGDYTIDESGFILNTGGAAGNADTIQWRDGSGNLRGAIGTNSSNQLTLFSYDGSLINIAAQIDGSINTILPVAVEGGISVNSGTLNIANANFKIDATDMATSEGSTDEVWGNGQFLRLSGMARQPLLLPQYSDATRPSASSWEGGAIWNTTDNRVQTSDGSVWQRVSYI